MCSCPTLSLFVPVHRRDTAGTLRKARDIPKVARSIRSQQLETRTARLKLPVQRKPVFVKLSPGIHLGYRRNQTAGAWVVRCVLGGADWATRIGIADDFEDANGNSVLDFWQAQGKARALGRDDRGGDDSAKPATVRETLDAYEADLKTRAGDVGNITRLRGHIPTGMREKAV